MFALGTNKECFFVLSYEECIGHKSEDDFWVQQEDVIRLLLKHGAEVYKKDAYQFTAADYAIKNGIDLEKLRKGLLSDTANLADARYRGVRGN
jgi:ankyrin repeat protein